MQNQPDLREYIRPLQRWWWLLVVATVVAMLSSYIYSAIQPDVYVSRATISVGAALRNPNPTSYDIYLAQQLTETYVDIANRAPLRAATMQALGMDWLPWYIVSQAAGRPILDVQVYDEDPERAFWVAEELVRQIILLGPAGKEVQDRQAFLDQQLQKLEDSITQTELAIIEREDKLLTIDSARELAAMQAEIAALQTKLSTLQQNYAGLLTTTQRGAVNALEVLEEASLPTESQPSNILINTLVAAVVGLTLAAGGAYLLEFLDNTLKDGEEVKKTLDITLLGSVPKILESETGADGKLIMLQTTQSPVIEAYRVLRTNLQFAAVDRSLRLLLISSSQPEDGKSLTTANLSIALARSGKRVVLVDADLHRPTQHRLFNLYNNIGVTTALLAEDTEIEQLLQPTLVPGLSVLTSGPLPPNPAELLGSQRMQQILTQLKEVADIVVIDSPPISAVVDSIILSTTVDGMLLVLRAGKTSREAAKRSLNALEQVRAPVLGMVLNGVDARSGGYYYYDNYGYYNVAYGRSASASSNTNGKTVSKNGDAAPATVEAEIGADIKHNGHANGYTNGHSVRPHVPDAVEPPDSALGHGRRPDSANGSVHRGPSQSNPRRRSGLPWK